MQTAAHRKLVNAIAQPGIPYLARPIHAVMKELAINLNGKLNSDSVARTYDLKISVVGFHLSKRQTPLAWELSRGPIESNENRYFKVVKHQLGKFLRENPNGLWAETLGNPGETIYEDSITSAFTADRAISRQLRNFVNSGIPDLLNIYYFFAPGE